MGEKLDVGAAGQGSRSSRPAGAGSRQGGEVIVGAARSGGLGDPAMASVPNVAELLADTTPAPGPGEKEVTSDPLKPGDVVGEYRIEGLLGRGGMGWVYAGVHPVIEKEVAVKVLKSALADQPEAVRRFVSEAKAVNRIRHPNIVDIFSFGQLGSGAPYFVMDRLPGESLSERLASGEPVTYGEAKHIFAQVMNAMEAAHDAGVVHRDLKPDNIFLARHQHDHSQVKLLDFGVAKLTEDGISQGRTSTGVPIGTPAYMSPEQCRGKAVDHRSDIYALGVVLYELFAGEVPFTGDSYMEVVFAQVHNPPPSPGQRVEIPPELESLILWCLHKEPGGRPESIAALRRPLLDCLGALPEGEAPRRTTPPGTGVEAASLAPTAATGEAERSSRSTSLETSAEALAFAAPRGRRKVVVAGVAAAVATLGALVLWPALRPASNLEPLSSGVDVTKSMAETERNDVAGMPPSSEPTRSAQSVAMPAPDRRTMPAPPAAAGAAATMTPANRPTVTVRLRSTPPGAAVYRGGKRIANTPRDLGMPREHKPTRFRFVLAGHQTVTRTVTLSRDVEVKARLHKAAGNRRVRPRRPASEGFKLTQ